MNSCRQIDWPLKFNVLRLVEISFFVVPSTVIMPKTAIYQHLTLFSLTRKPGLGQPPKETKKLFFLFPHPVLSFGGPSETLAVTFPGDRGNSSAAAHP